MNEVAPKTEDTASAPPQVDPQQMEIEIVDTVAAAPEVEQQAPPAPAPLIAGKFRTIEEAEKAYSEAQRAMHEKAQEAATYRKMLDEPRQAQPAPAYSAAPSDYEEKIREKLAESPGATIFDMARFAARQIMDEQQRAQRETVKKYQSFASRPEFADVAQEVAAELPFADQPIDPIEGMFLRKKLQKLEAQLAGGVPQREVAPPFVESGNGGRRAMSSALRVELDADTAKLRPLGQDKMRDLARVVAKQKMAGGTMREMSIDDWEKANA